MSVRHPRTLSPTSSSCSTHAHKPTHTHTHTYSLTHTHTHTDKRIVPQSEFRFFFLFQCSINRSTWLGMSADRHKAGLCLQVQLNKKAIQATLAISQFFFFSLMLKHSKLSTFSWYLWNNLDYRLKIWWYSRQNMMKMQTHLTWQ